MRIKVTGLNHKIILFIFSISILICCTPSDQSEQSSDDKKINSLLDVYRDSMIINPDMVIDIFREIQPQIKDSVSFYNIFLIFSELYLRKNNPDSSFYFNEQVLNFCNRQRDSEEILTLKARAANINGIIYIQTDQRDSAIIYLEETYDILNHIKGKDMIVDVCINLADCYQQNGNFPLSGYYYRQALFLSDSLYLEKNYLPIYSGMSRLYNELDNFAMADSFLNQAEKYIETGSDYEKHYFANSRGYYYYNIKEYDKALYWLRQAYQISKSFQQTIPRAVVECNLGEIFILIDQPDSALLYLNDSKSSWGDLYYQPSVKFYVDGLFASLSLYKNNLSDAEKILLQKYDTAAIVPQYIYFHNKRMQQLYELKNDYKNAYKYKIEADAYNDSLRNIKVQQSIAETDFRYQQDKKVLEKDLQIAEVEIQASQWKNIALIGFLSFIIILVITAGLILYRKRLRELRYNKQLATINRLRMEVIRNRISPHFTFNVLNAIMPALNEYKGLEQPFKLLVQMLRANLRASEKISITLDEEINLVKNYLQLYLINHPGRIRVNWEISQDLRTDILIPSMSIQIPIENAIKYAFPEKIKEPHINIHILKKEDGLEILIKDNGIGFHSSNDNRMEKGTGNGLRMLYQTAEVLNSQNTTKIIFKIQDLNQEDSTMNGTQVLIFVPFNYRFDL